MFSSKTLFVFYRDDNSKLVEESPIEADALRLTLDMDLTPEEIANLPPDYPRIPSNFDPDRAVNDLDYIIDNSTLIYATEGLAYGNSRTEEFYPFLCPPPPDDFADCRDLEEDIT